MRTLYHIPLVHSSGEVANDFSYIDNEVLRSDIRKTADSLSEDYWDAFEPAFWKEKMDCSHLAIYFESITEDMMTKSMARYGDLDKVRYGTKRFVLGKRNSGRTTDFLDSLMLLGGNLRKTEDNELYDASTNFQRSTESR
ncbi:MAG: hypothetical protein HZB68_03610 [Candidatus Aenigmarchaeota archaeon]|nr:hypothetical protein [Candidatus Aenigmarchaeota archaeon]